MSQYQHFIPKFILRKWGGYVEPDLAAYTDKAAWEKAKKRVQKKAGVNALILENGFDKITLERRNCSTICGLNDMYGDEIEGEFCKIEKKIADIVKKLEINNIVGGGDNNKSTGFLYTPTGLQYNNNTTDLLEAEVDELRRFLFLMLYRSRSFHHRFPPSTTGYNSKDQASLFAYMKTKGFKTPREVWLNNFRVFLQVPLDDRKAWEQKLIDKAYPEDAKMFIDHVNNYSLHICVPADKDDTFILTQNAYGITEGPNSSSGWTSWHFFSPISPRLLIVLRRNDIIPYSDASTWVYTFPDNLINNLGLGIHSDPAMLRSWLRDLAVFPPSRCSSNDKQLTFQQYPIPGKHVQCVNSVLLENASSTKMIIYSEEKALVRALEFFLQIEKRGLKVSLPIDEELNPDLIIKASGDVIKKFMSINDHGYDSYLDGLEHVAAAKLKSSAKVRRTIQTPNTEAPMPHLSPLFQARYIKLGWNGTVIAWLEDFEKASEILRSYDLAEMCQSLGLEDELLDRLFEGLPLAAAAQIPRQAWLGSRIWRAIRAMPGTSLSTQLVLAGNLHEVTSDDFMAWGDKIADVSTMFRRDSIPGLMALALEVQCLQDLWSLRQAPEKSQRKNHLRIAYTRLGSIRNCGIEALESQAAAALSEHLLDPKIQDLTIDRFTWNEETRILSEEIQLRMWLYQNFEAAFSSNIDPETKQTLKYVLFSIAYPLYFTQTSDPRDVLEDGVGV